MQKFCTCGGMSHLFCLGAVLGITRSIDERTKRTAQKDLPMSHNLENRNGVYSFAFTGERNQIWHKLGQELSADATRLQWIEAAGFGFDVLKVPAIVSLEGAEFDHIPAQRRMLPADNKKFLVRRDNGHVLGLASDMYQVVQPADVMDWFERYITVDERFHLDAAGVLSHGEHLWMTARFNGDLTVAGDRHVARLLMSTSYDLSKPTINQATTTRVVCNNTLNVAHADKGAVIRTRHTSRFDGSKVHRELGQIASSFAKYKALGDAMAQTSMAAKDVSEFFKTLLEIPFEAKREDVSTRKMNQFADLSRAFTVTKRERGLSEGSGADVWTSLQAVTRYVDHDRSVRNADNELVGRFESATFGSGDAVKGKAMELLLPRIVDKVPVAV